MRGWRLLDETTFMKRDGYDEDIPAVGKVGAFYELVEKPRFNKDVRFSAVTLKNFLKPSNDRALMGSWRKVSVPTWAWTMPSGESLGNASGGGPAVVHSPAELISILNLDGAANAALQRGALCAGARSKGSPTHWR